MSDVMKNWGNPPDDIDKPQWSVVKINPNGIVITYQEKYGELKTVECIGLWENASQYMLTWKDDKKIFLQKENIDSIKAEIKSAE